MQYVDFGKGDTNRSLDMPGRLTTFYNHIKTNITAYSNYVERTNRKLPSNHIMVQMCNVIYPYMGASPSDTYNNLIERTRYFASLFGILHLGVGAAIVNMALGRDVLVSKVDDRISVFDSFGKIKPNLKPLQLCYHEATSINPAYYDPTMSSDEYSLYSINIPLFGAMMHEARDAALRKDIIFDKTEFINKVLILDNVTDNINMALINRYSFDAVNRGAGESVYVEIDGVYPYTFRDLNPMYLQVRGDVFNHIRELGRASIGDIQNNIPLIDGAVANDFIPKFDDYYQDSLMWSNALPEIGQYYKILSLTEGCKVRLDNRNIERRLDMLLPNKMADVVTNSDPMIIGWLDRVIYK